MKKDILVLEKSQNQWKLFLEEFFEDSDVSVSLFEDPAKAGEHLDQKGSEIVFLEPSALSMALCQKLNVQRARTPGFRAYQLGKVKESESTFLFDEQFDGIPSISEFQKKLVDQLPLPDPIRLLVIDDEPDVGFMVNDYLRGRTSPAFQVSHVADGEAGLESIKKEKPNVILLDLKMPIKDGYEVYKTLQKDNLDIPVIIFFDAVHGEEVVKIKRFGNPAIVEKGSQQSSPSELMALIKKLAYFG